MGEERDCIIVSNRLPVRWDGEAGRMVPSSGGLVTAVRGARLGAKSRWVGALPGTGRQEWDRAVTESDGDPEAMGYTPVFLDPDQYDAYYNGMGNDALWPLLHYESRLVKFDEANWQAYKAVNERFAEAVLAICGDDDRVWVHDFHLMLLPRLLRAERPDLKIGFFLHVPFPSSEIFRQLPVRGELLRALLDADLIGFHDYDYLRHFSSALRAILGIESNLLSVQRLAPSRHVTQLGVFPVSIDTAHFARSAAAPAVLEQVAAACARAPTERLILGVDRLDYTKGIELKLEAFRRLLRDHPEWRGRARLLQVAVPSRPDVPEYQRLRTDVEQLVGAINGEFATPDHVPVNYLYTSVPFDTLVALYRQANALLVTSRRDGMNLVALEYVACQDADDPGVVCLSEFAGSISILSHALPVNPWDVDGSAEALHRALTMSRDERRSRHRAMISGLERYDAAQWARSFVASLDAAASARSTARRAGVPDPATVAEAARGRELVLLLDYDGTLVPIAQTPDAAVATDDVLDLLRHLAGTAGVHATVVSGRDQAFLQAQLGALNLGFAAEHGAVYRPPGSADWIPLVAPEQSGWYPVARQIMEDFARRTPGAFVEEKAHAVAWHYRNAPAGFAAHQARRLVMELENTLANLPVRAATGRKVIEARAMEADKGSFCRWLLQRLGLDEARATLVVLGDDVTDEDLFNAAGPGAVTIKVGTAPTVARYRLADQAEVLPFLRDLLAARLAAP